MSLNVPPPGAPAAWLTRDERKRLTRRSFTIGFFWLIVHFAAYGATLYAAVAPYPLWVNLLAAALNGFMIGMIFMIGHDASHGAYLPSRLGNQIVTRLTFLPALHVAPLWDIGHNQGHHARTNLKGQDYVWAPLTKAEFDTLSPARRLLERIYRSWVGPFLNYAVEIWLPKFLLVPPEARNIGRRYWPDILLVAVGGLLIIAGIGALGTWLASERPVWQTLLVAWLLPFAIWNYVMSLTIYLQHTHPQMPWFDDPEAWSTYNAYVRGTAQVDVPINALPMWTNMLRGHAAHHVMPAVPIYKLPQAQARLHSRYEDDRVRYTLRPLHYGPILRACKLYDFERMCWTDFDGNPTSDPIPLHGRHNTPVLTPLAALPETLAR